LVIQRVVLPSDGHSKARKIGRQEPHKV